MIKKACFALSAMTLLTASAPTMASSEEIEMLKRQIAALEQRIAAREAVEVQAKEPAPQQTSIGDRVTISGTVEVEGATSNKTDWADDSNSDITVATVELAIAAQITDSIDTEIVLLHEEDDTDLEVDVAVINFTDIGGTGTQVTLGEQYVPFGIFETNMINDTLVLELAETGETAALMRWENEGLTVAAYAFNGDIDSGNDAVENFGISVGYSNDNVAVGIDYISNVLDSDVISEIATASTEDYAGVVVHGQVNLGAVSVIAEYLMIEKLDASKITSTEITSNIEPEALQLEVAFDAGDYTFAIAYQETDEAVELGQPEERISLGASTDLDENVSLAFELWHDEDYSVADGGTGVDADSFVAQVAVSF
ncbi:MAG: LbtU family siderophore porin [Motiliproteus sp.]